jgi:glycosyltransferase involved in cell wall biosynthesis
VTIRVISNVPGLREVGGSDIEFLPHVDRGMWSAVRTFLRSFRYDYILLNGLPRSLLLLCLLKWIVPFNRCRIVALDVLFSGPRTPVERLKTAARGAVLRHAHRIIVYYRQTQELERVFGLPHGIFEYVPFKINQYDLVTRAVPTDQGYIFCGGKTRRDFKTLIEAVAPLDYPVRIVTTPNSDIVHHGSYLDETQELPPNVEVVRLDGSAGPFIDLMAGARLVVLPRKPDIAGVGIGVYIMAMALGKCVVISSGVSVDGVLTPDLAMMVPPEDPGALRDAIVRLWSDTTLRERIAVNGRRYAASLGDERRLYESIIRFLRADAHARNTGAASRRS